MKKEDVVFEVKSNERITYALRIRKIEEEDLTLAIDLIDLVAGQIKKNKKWKNKLHKIVEDFQEEQKYSL